MPFEFDAIRKGGYNSPRYLRRICRYASLAVAVFLIATDRAAAGRASPSQTDIARLCDRAASVAARSQGVPVDILKAITRAETGRAGKSDLRPWPWTVNMEGAGRWFATEEKARTYVFEQFKRGARSFDIGCFQINYKWHGAAFGSIEEMFDPVLNAEYAAQFLRRLYREFGNWPDAVGAYHSRSPEFALPYTTRFKKIRARMTLRAEIAPPPSGGSGGLGFRLALPLLPPTGTQPRRPRTEMGGVSIGSLVPLTEHTIAGRPTFITLE